MLTKRIVVVRLAVVTGGKIHVLDLAAKLDQVCSLLFCSIFKYLLRLTSSQGWAPANKQCLEERRKYVPKRVLYIALFALDVFTRI